MRRALLSLTLAAAGAAAIGCGESSGGNPAASTARSGDEAQLAFARCMREQGIDMPDPQGDGRQRRALRIDGDVSPQVLQRATRECRESTGGGPPELSPQQREEFRDAALRFARCMREHGVDMPDPQVRGGGMLFRRGGGGQGGGIEPDSPAFQRAQAACRDLLPAPRRAR